MTTYVEKFVINRKTYGIEALLDGNYKPWVGGCAIGGPMTLPEARETLHRYAISQNEAERGSGQRMVENAETALRRLGNDTFNLGRFRVEGDSSE